MRLLFISALLLLFSSCYKDVDNTALIEVITEQPRIDMETGLTGHVDEGTELPMSDYSLQINDEIYEVPESHFYFHINDLDKEGQLVEVIKDGEIVSVAYSYLVENDINRLELESFPDAVEATADGVIAIKDGISMNVSLTDLVDGSGIEVSEAVSSRLVVLEDKELLNQFGSSAYTKEGALLSINPKLGFTVGFHSASGTLSLSAGSKITFNISTFQGQQLYAFHREFGYWLELGTIGLSEITTDQLGYYLIGDSNPGIYSEGTIKNDDKVVSFINGSHTLGDQSFSFLSTENGRWAHVLPEARALETNLYDPCKNLLASNELLVSETSQVNHESNLPDKQLFNISAEIIDCNGNNFENPSISINSHESSEEVYVFSGSSTERKIAICNPEFKIAGYDLANSDKGPQIPWALDKDDQLKYLSNCKSQEDGYTYVKINEEVHVYPHFNYVTIEDETRFFTSNSTFEIRIKGDAKDFYSDDEVNIAINDPSIGDDGYFISCLNSENGCGIDDLRITHINESGEGWIRASFRGTLWMRTIQNPTAGNYSIEGVILIKQ